MFDSSGWLLIFMTNMFSYIVCFDETSLGKSSLVNYCETTSIFQGCAPSC